MQQEPLVQVPLQPFRSVDSAFPPGQSMELLSPIRVRPGLYALPDSPQMRYRQSVLDHGPKVFFRQKGPMSSLKEAQIACRFLQPAFSAEDRDNPERLAAKETHQQIITDVQREFAKQRYRERNRFTRIGIEPLVVMDSLGRGIVGVDSPEKIPTRGSVFLKEPPRRIPGGAAAGGGGTNSGPSGNDRTAGASPGPGLGGGASQIDPGQLKRSATEDRLLFSRRVDVNRERFQRLAAERRMRAEAVARQRWAFAESSGLSQEIDTFEKSHSIQPSLPSMDRRIRAEGTGPPASFGMGYPAFFASERMPEIRFGGFAGVRDLAGQTSRMQASHHAA